MTESSILSDKRLYLWIKHEDIAFFQSNLEAEEGLARIRTEKKEGNESLIVLLYMASREEELKIVLKALENSGVETRTDVAR
jgi:hypothetical protein